MLSEETSARLRAHISALCCSPRIPHSEGYFESQKYLHKILSEMGYETKEQHFHVWGLGQCTNIYVENKAKTHERGRTIIGAHYESTPKSGLAADDNASAVAVSLELARVARDLSTPLTFVFFDMEEHYFLRYLRGSAQFAKFYSERIEKVLIMDLVGGVLTQNFENSYLQFGNAWGAFSHSNLEFLHLPMLIVEPFGRLGARSDYDSFRRKNLPFTFISSGTPWYYHTHFDTPEVLKFEKMTQLVETLSLAIHSPSNLMPYSNDSQSIKYFLKKFRQLEGLNQDFLEKLIVQNEPLSRFQVMRLYSQVLPLIRRKPQNSRQQPV